MQLSVPAVLLINYVLLLARVGAMVSMLPFPGIRRSFPVVRVVLTASLAAMLAPLALSTPEAFSLDDPARIALLAKLVLSEAVLGLSAGVVLRLLFESFGLAAQALGFQAGYSYVNAVDPTSEVDSSILNIAFALLANLFFFAFELHLFVVRAFARSLERWPLGTFALRPADAQAMIAMGAETFDFAVRLALPVMAVLLLVDLTLGLLNQVHSRMQLLALSFSMKIVAAAAVIYAVLPLSVGVFRGLSEKAGVLLMRLLSG